MLYKSFCLLQQIVKVSYNRAGSAGGFFPLVQHMLLGSPESFWNMYHLRFPHVVGAYVGLDVGEGVVELLDTETPSVSGMLDKLKVVTVASVGALVGRGVGLGVTGAFDGSGVGLVVGSGVAATGLSDGSEVGFVVGAKVVATDSTGSEVGFVVG